jgi:hypothetical protein
MKHDDGFDLKNRMGKVDQFLHDLKHYDKDNIHPAIIKNVKPYLANENFNVAFVSTKSAAAAGKSAFSSTSEVIRQAN